MDNTRIKRLVEELDSLVPKEGAVIAFRQYGEGPNDSMIAGSRVGLLRAGVELLRAGIDVAEESSQEVKLTRLQEITHAQSEYRFDFFHEMALPEDPAERERQARVATRILIGLLILVVAVICLAGYGFIRLFF